MHRNIDPDTPPDQPHKLGTDRATYKHDTKSSRKLGSPCHEGTTVPDGPRLALLDGLRDSTWGQLADTRLTPG